MGKINWGRVVVGGLAAGVVLNIFDRVVNGVWFTSAWTEATRGYHLKPAGGSPILWFVLYDLLLGMFIVWLYAAIRPRYGPGSKTAMFAGLAVWALVVFLHAMAEVPEGILPARLYILPGIVGLFFLPLAGVAGGSLYKEEPPA